VLLITSSIALAFIQALTFGDVANGVLIYNAQAFMLAGALFGLDYYLDKITKISKNAVDKQDNSSLH
jgi:hypothetical protein